MKMYNSSPEDRDVIIKHLRNILSDIKRGRRTMKSVSIENHTCELRVAGGSINGESYRTVQQVVTGQTITIEL